MSASHPDGSSSNVTIRAIRPEERDECLDLWVTVWPGEGSRRYFERYFYADAEWLPYYTRVAEVDGRIVSAAHICKRTVYCGVFSLTMGGLANVATLPQYRGRGYNSGCVRSAVEIMAADAMDFALLFTGINTYYARFGFSDLARFSTSVVVQNGCEFGHFTHRVRSAEVRDLPTIHAIYSTYNAPLYGAVHRSEAYWRDWLEINPEIPPSDMLVAEDGSGKVAGYLRTGVHKSAVPYSDEEAQTRIIEHGVGAATEVAQYEITLALLQAAVNRSQAAAGTLVMDIAMTPPVRRAIKALATDDGITAAPLHSAMVRLLHRENLLRSMLMLWNEQWPAAGRPRRNLMFETPCGPVLLDSSGSLLKICPAEAECGSAVRVSQSQLFGLLFGSLNPESISESANAQLLLAALFPARSMAFWGADGF